MIASHGMAGQGGAVHEMDLVTDGTAHVIF